jgi:oxalate decarboxylase/phosphoglucose isomerase-like protein (cupin superfamily)/NAD-dependent dihydropyrimidine dehydrogenase PreA subunit
VLKAVLRARDLVGNFDKPRYITFAQDLCAHSRSGIVGCRRCLDLCPTAAIAPDGDHVAIDPNICAGCGQCAAVCPTGAAGYALPPADALMRRLRTLLTVTARELGVSTDIAGVNMRLNAGGVRELHWHKAAEWAFMLYGNARITAVDAQGHNFVDDVGVGEWQYYIEGQARMGVFGASGQARTFDYRAGDVGFVPFAMGHYIENTGNTRLRFLEIFKSSYYADVSLDTWMALTPPELVEAHLKLDQQVMSALRNQKVPVVPA